MRPRKAIRHGVDLVQRFAHFEKQHVGAGLHVRFAPLEGLFESFDHQRVAPCDDDELVVAPGIERSADLLHHLVLRNEPFAHHVAAALQPRLILDVDATDTGTLEFAHGYA